MGNHFNHSTGPVLGATRRAWLPLLAALLLLAALSPPSPAAREQALTGQQLWERAVAAEKNEELTAAAAYFERLHREHPANPAAEEALWRAAVLRKTLAEQDPDPDWERVRDLFRRHTVDYPQADRRDQAYLELGIAHFRMRFLREALTYFRLFEQRYPDSPLLPRARYWQARTLVETGALPAAAALYQELSRAPDESLAFDALAALGRTKALLGDHLRALDHFHELMRRFPLARFTNPEVLFDLGLSNFAVGREEEGREQLFTFINLAPTAPQRLTALFEIGESRRRQGDQAAAQRLYRQVVEEGGAGQRPVVLARFRQAEFLDESRRLTPDLPTRRDPADPAGDRPYQAVIDGYGREPIAQDARYGLYQRLRERDDLAGAIEVAHGYVRNAPVERLPGIDPERVGRLLVFLIANLLERGDYQRVYHLYVNEHHHVLNYEPGRLRFMIGRALEELALYRQAAVVYYRALAGPLDPDELAEVYYRRAEVYFALKDYATAERLLAHLRRIYADEPGRLAEVFWLSGRLRALEGKYGTGREFLLRSLEYPADPQRRVAHLPTAMRALETMADFTAMLAMINQAAAELADEAEVADEAKMATEAAEAAPALLQTWYRRTGDGLRRQGLELLARQAYEAALASGMPQAGEDFQAAGLHLGTMLAAGDQAERERAEGYLTAAAAGPDQLLAAMARQQLNSLRIVASKDSMQSLFER